MTAQELLNVQSNYIDIKYNDVIEIKSKSRSKSGTPEAPSELPEKPNAPNENKKTDGTPTPTADNKATYEKNTPEKTAKEKEPSEIQPTSNGSNESPLSIIDEYKAYKEIIQENIDYLCLIYDNVSL